VTQNRSPEIRLATARRRGRRAPLKRDVPHGPGSRLLIYSTTVTVGPRRGPPAIVADRACSTCLFVQNDSNLRFREPRMPELQLVEYDDAWPSQFLLVAEQVGRAVPSPGATVEHIGSTAVPGLCSKPVLDVLLGVALLADVEGSIPALAAAGFVYRPEHESRIPDRRYFVKPEGALPRVHLHAVVRGGTLWRQHLRFRDRLRHDTRLMLSYAALKRHLAVIHAGDKPAYTEAKAPFIQQVLAAGPAGTDDTDHGAG
jgi:GrpB-like predicted nucleotidyltransferase (UPF0157 family)